MVVAKDWALIASNGGNVSGVRFPPPPPLTRGVPKNSTKKRERSVLTLLNTSFSVAGECGRPRSAARAGRQDLGVSEGLCGITGERPEPYRPLG